MILSPITAEQLILLVVESHGIRGVRVVRHDADRIFCSDTEGLLKEYCETKAASGEWSSDLVSTASAYHPGAKIFWSVREKDVSPALQVVEKEASDTPELYARGICYELDLDFYAPQHAVFFGLLPNWRLFKHSIEVLHNKITGRKTDPAELARTPRIAAILTEAQHKERKLAELDA